MGTLEYLANRFHLDLTQKSPILIREVNRPLMAQVLCGLGYRKGVEVGTAEGYHAEILCRANPDLRLICVDPYRPYQGYRDFTTSTRLEGFYQEACARLKPYHAHILREFSTGAADAFEDGALDFVYIDGNHDLFHVIQDIVLWLPKIRKDGLIFGHDFKRSPNLWKYQQVKDAVGAYTYANRIKPWFVLGEEGPRDGTPYREGTQAWGWVC